MINFFRYLTWFFEGDQLLNLKDYIYCNGASLLCLDMKVNVIVEQ